MSQPIIFNTAIMSLYVLVYVIAASVFLRAPWPGPMRRYGFALVNLLAVWSVFFSKDWTAPWLVTAPEATRFGGYLAFGLAHFALLVWLRTSRSGPAYVGALWMPIVALVFAKVDTVWQLVGLSYMAFRMAQAAMEMRRNPDMALGLGDYIGFLFFPPTIPVGPISPFAMHQEGLRSWRLSPVTVLRGLARIMVGLVMYKFLAPIPQQMTFANLWTDGYKHGVTDFLISSYAYLAYLYFNFAGACHMAIGVAALLGIPVKENFNNPIFSRNIKDFWNRWHISLSEFVRDLIFIPVTMTLMRILGPFWAVPSTVVAAMLTFMVIGIWHGHQVGFIIFGFLNGLGFCIHYLFETSMRKLKWHRSALFQSRAWKVFAIALTLTYIALTMIFVEYQDLEKIRALLSVFA